MLVHRKSTVTAAVSDGYTHREMSRSIQTLFDSFEPRVDSLIKRGDKVFVKPYLTQMGSSDPSTRRVSHPLFVRCVVEAVRDCGGSVSFGDVGLHARGASIPSDKKWLYELAHATGATPVSFARAGTTPVGSGLLYPKYYYVSNAVLDADVVVNCANALAQDGLLFTGAIRNMFNSIVGRQQRLLYSLFDAPEDLAKAIVGVFGTVRPSISLLDMTLVKEPGRHGSERPVGLILGSKDAVALDRLAMEILGYGEHPLWTSVIGAQRALGHSDLGSIKIAGADISKHILNDFPLPKMPSSSAKASLPALAKRALNHVLFSPKPAIFEDNCTSCGDCIDICPVGAINHRSGATPTINPAACIDCGYCAAVCNSHAVYSKHIGAARWWSSAKAGGSVGLGPVRLHLRVSRNRRVGKKMKGISANTVPARTMPPAVRPTRPADSGEVAEKAQGGSVHV